MGKEKIAITLGEEYVSELDRECARLDASAEKAMAEDGLAEDFRRWPPY